MTGFKTRKGYAAEYLEARTDAHEVHTWCAMCSWEFWGRADVSREKFKAHYKAKHPGVLKPRKRGKSIWKRRAT